MTSEVGWVVGTWIVQPITHQEYHGMCSVARHSIIHEGEVAGNQSIELTSRMISEWLVVPFKGFPTRRTNRILAPPDYDTSVFPTFFAIFSENSSLISSGKKCRLCIYQIPSNHGSELVLAEVALASARNRQGPGPLNSLNLFNLISPPFSAGAIETSILSDMHLRLHLQFHHHHRRQIFCIDRIESNRTEKNGKEKKRIDWIDRVDRIERIDNIGEDSKG